MKYLAIDGELLANQTIPPISKLIISFIGNLNKGGKRFYGSHLYLSQTLGVRYDHLEKAMGNLLRSHIIEVTDEGIRLQSPIDVIGRTDWNLGY